ncbi:MAG: FmdB family zinc ribbon protein, partial [Dehalococcoidia bacterium]
MPRYDYRCSVCGHVYEKREGFDAPPLQTCPDCAGVARRVLTSPAIVFKGSGWYINDSRKGTGDDSSSSSPSSTVPSSDGGSTETKDEAGRGE